MSSEAIPHVADDIAISARNLTKTYRLFDHPGDRIKQFLSLGTKRYHREFTALKDVSFDIKKGETVGIIGRNGSGKSTLLQTICEILKPSAGSLSVNGRISALLELGAGFNPEFTGRENVHFQGLLMGMGRAEIDQRIDEIATFADIGRFLDQPVRTYSSGMFVRLAFSVAVHAAPNILIVDEALSVGDIAFQARSIRRMKQLLESGCTLILVSHDMEIIKTLCRKTILLNNGKVEFFGNSEDICDAYIRKELMPIHTDSTLDADRDERHTGSAKILRTELSTGDSIGFVFSCEIILRIQFAVLAALDRLVVSFYIKDRQQLSVIGANSEYENVRLGPLNAGESGEIEFRLRNSLRAGAYSVTVILADSASQTEHYYDWLDTACKFETQDLPGEPRWAIVSPEVKVNLLPRSFSQTRSDRADLEYRRTSSVPCRPPAIRKIND